MTLDTSQIARTFGEMAAILELKGENPFRVRAYLNAARALDSLEGDLAEMVASGTIMNVAGIGKNIAAHLCEIIATGKLAEYDELKKSVPAGVMRMLAIQGLGPKKVKALWERLHVKDIDVLELVCRQGRVAKLPGFGQKTQDKILQGIGFLKRFQGRFLFCDAMSAAVVLQSAIEALPATNRAEIAGSLRRRAEIVGDIDILASSKKPAQLMDAFTGHPLVEAITAKGSTKSSVVLKNGINADLRVVADNEFPFALHYFTGSKEHNVAMRARAKKAGLKLSEYGLFRGDKPTPCRDEAAIFKALGLDFIPPELRENTGEIDAAEAGTLPELVEYSDLRGVLHVHSNFSDGVATVEEMARAAKAMGLSYLGIADHSRSAAYAGGLSIDDVKRQHREIDSLNKKLKGFHIFKGIECDALEDGSLDYPDEVLASFDFVIVAIHSRFTADETTTTKRICTALKNPHVTMLAHPTGRLLLAREGYAVNMDDVIACAADHGVAIEINANPHRLDLDWRLCRRAKELGVKMPINPDAHSPETLHDIAYGVGIARKGWLTKKDVLNAMTAEELKKYWKKKKKITPPL